MEELISVIVPVYNVEKYLHNCIQSIINQTYNNLEIIIVNDGSTDKSGEICNKLKNEDSRVKVFHIDNKGVSYARNLGLKNAQGKYIIFCDSDDLLENDMIEKLYKNLIENEVDISICNYKIIDENNEVKENEIEGKIPNILKKEEFYKYLYRAEYYCGYLWNKLIRRKVLYNNENQLILFDENVHIMEDVLYFCKLENNIKKVYFDDKHYLYNYIQREKSALSTKMNLKKATVLYTYPKILEFMNKYDKEQVCRMKYEYIFHAMKVKYMLYINGLLSKNIKKELNKIRDTYLMEVLKSKDVKIASKVKLLANAYTNYIYGKIVDLKNKVWKK